MPHRRPRKNSSTKKGARAAITSSTEGAASAGIAAIVASAAVAAPAVSDTVVTDGRRQRWSPEVTYRAGQQVDHEGGVYRSRVDGNLGHRPDTSSDCWFERRGPKLKTLEQIRNQQAATYRALALGTIDRSAATARFRGLEGIARTAELALLERQIAIAERDGSGTLEVRHVRGGQQP